MTIKLSKKQTIPAILLFIGFILIFTKLGDRKLWVDECVSAYLSANIIEYGYPSVYDGYYYKSVANGNDSNKHGVEAWYSWLTIYLQAFFRFVFGSSEFATRLPTAIMGWLAMLYLFFSLKRITTNVFIQYFTLALYVFCLPLLLYMRSAHYYSGVLLFVNISLLYFLKLIKEPEKYRNAIILGIALTLLFHSNYFLFIIPAFSYFIYSLVKIRNRKFWTRFILAYGIAFLLTTPWFLYIIATTKGTKVSMLLGLTTTEDIIMRFFIYFWKIQAYFFPFIILLLLLGIVKITANIFKIKPSGAAPINASLLIGLFIGLTIFLSPILEPLAQTRRLLAAVPILFLLTAIVVYEILRYSRTIGYLIVPILIFTNWLNILPWKYIGWLDVPVHKNIAFQSPITLQTLLPANAYCYAMNEGKYSVPLLDFYDELTVEFNSRTDAIIDYLLKNAKPGESVICATIEAPKIYYYTKLKIVKQLDIDGSVWGPLGTFYFKDYPNVRRCLKYDYAKDDEIDWVLSQDLVPFTFDDENYLKKNKHLFDEISINAPNAFIGNTAELDCHYFRPKEFCESIKIYHRRKQTAILEK